MIANKSNAREVKKLMEELTLDNYSLEDYVEGIGMGDITNISDDEDVDAKAENSQNSHEEQTGFDIKNYFINSVVFFNICSENINAFCEINNIGSIKIDGLRYDNECNAFRVFEVYKVHCETEVMETGVGQVQPDFINLLSDDENKSNVQLREPTVSEMGILNNINYIETPRINILFPYYNKNTFLRIKNFLSIRTVNEVVCKNENDKQLVLINDILQVIQPNLWLNDVVINFYINLLVKASKNKVLVFDTYFFKRVANNGYTNYLNNMLKNIKLFEYSKIIIPTHLETIQHWVLIIVEPQAKTITYFDSCLNLKTFKVLSEKIAVVVSFLNMVYRAQDHYIPMSTWEIKCGNSPLQNNTNDCGVFVCTNARYVIFNKQLNYSHHHSVILRQRITYEILSNKILPTL